jgi:transposase
MNNSVIGLDIAKNIFQLFTLLDDGKTLKKKLKRHELLAFFANYPASIIGIEARQAGAAVVMIKQFTQGGS